MIPTIIVRLGKIDSGLAKLLLRNQKQADGRPTSREVCSGKLGTSLASPTCSGESTSFSAVYASATLHLNSCKARVPSWKPELSFAFAFRPFYIRAAVVMTYEEAQRIVRIANQPTSRLFVEWAKLRQESNGTCSAVIEPVYGEQRVYSDAQQAGWALSALLVEASKASDLLFHTV